MISNLADMLASIVFEGWSWWWVGINQKDQLARAVVTLSVVTVAIFWCKWMFKISRKETVPPLPPGPRGLPLVGYLPFLDANLHRSFAKLAHVHGPIMKLWLGNQLVVILSSSSLVKEVLRDQDITFANRDPPVAALTLTYGGLDLVWSSYGAHWRMLRRCAREMLSPKSLEACYALRRHEVRKAIRRIYNKKIGTPIDIGELMFQTVLDLIMNIMWGGSQDGEESGLGIECRKVAEEVVRLMGKANISDLFPILAPFDIQGVDRRSKKVLLWLNRFFDPIIDKRLKLNEVKGDGTFNTKEGNKDFLQFLLEVMEKKDTQRSTPRTEVKALLLDIFVAATDTTSTTVEWVMTELMKNPEIMRRAQKELDDVVGMNNIVEESHLPKLQYLDAIVKETLRLHPAVPLLIPRCSSVSCVVGGYTIPKGARVFMNVWAIHRDPQVWNNPLEFQPERFLKGTGICDYSGNDFNYLPFGSGRRMCVGISLAERMLMYVLASLFHSFQWTLPKGTEIDRSEKFGLVLKKRTPLIAIPTPRLSNLELYE